MTYQTQKNFHTISDFTKCCWLVMLVVDIQHMQAVIKGFFFPKIATILVIWKSSDRETPSYLPVFNIYQRG